MSERRSEAAVEPRRGDLVTVAPAATLARDAVADPRGADLLILRGVRKQWGKSPVLEGVDLSVARGALVSISGANGTGKTTLLRIAAGLIHPDSGEVALDGLHPERNRRAFLGRLGFLSAGDRTLYARLSPRRHLDLGARLGLLPAGKRAAAIERALGVFALDDFADRRVDRLSMGQRQRVRLAMTFVHDPALVLLDEPANSLDQEGLDVLAAYLEQLRSRGGAAVWCGPTGIPVPMASDTALRLAEGRLRPE
jgi:ABC-2 type transport system ATP-binding protein